MVQNHRRERLLKKTLRKKDIVDFPFIICFFDSVHFPTQRNCNLFNTEADVIDLEYLLT